MWAKVLRVLQEGGGALGVLHKECSISSQGHGARLRLRVDGAVGA